jgi:uncharacterized membrane protein (UPF0127 family)
VRPDALTVPWLLRDGEVLAALEVATTRRRRRRGLLGRDGIDGALLLQPAKSVHTAGMRFALDVAYCGTRPGPAVGGPGVAVEGMPDDVMARLVVLDTTMMRRWRVGRPRWRARGVIEAEAGAFERWRLRPGDHLEVR